MAATVGLAFPLLNTVAVTHATLTRNDSRSFITIPCKTMMHKMKTT